MFMAPPSAKPLKPGAKKPGTLGGLPWWAWAAAAVLGLAAGYLLTRPGRAGAATGDAAPSAAAKPSGSAGAIPAVLEALGVKQQAPYGNDGNFDYFGDGYYQGGGEPEPQSQTIADGFGDREPSDRFALQSPIPSYPPSALQSPVPSYSPSALQSPIPSYSPSALQSPIPSYSPASAPTPQQQTLVHAGGGFLSGD